MSYFRLYILLIFLPSSFLYSQQMMVQNIHFRIDSIGNGEMNIAQSMSTQQWKIWSEGVGKDPAELKRNIIRYYPKYNIKKVETIIDEESKSYTSKVKAIGACKVNQNEKWIFNLADKGDKMSKLSEREFLLTKRTVGPNAIVLQKYTIVLPREARRVQLTNDAFENPILRFEMRQPSDISWSVYFQFTGGIILLLGGGLLLSKRDLF